MEYVCSLETKLYLKTVGKLCRRRQDLFWSWRVRGHYLSKGRLESVLDVESGRDMERVWCSRVTGRLRLGSAGSGGAELEVWTLEALPCAEGMGSDAARVEFVEITLIAESRIILERTETGRKETLQRVWNVSNKEREEGGEL